MRRIPLKEARLWATAEVVRRGLARGPYRVAVRTNSMGPWARAGDAFVIEPLGRRPRFGEVVAAVAGTKAVIHRLVGRRPGFYIIKGDASPRADAPVPRGNILGRVRALEKADGRVIRLGAGRARLLAVALGAISWLENAAAGFADPSSPLLRKAFYVSCRIACLLYPV